MSAEPFSPGESDALHARARAFVAAFEQGEPMPEAFDALGTDLVRFQARTNPRYPALVAARGEDPLTMTSRSAPAVPTDVFKMVRYASFPEALETKVFRTSGTTVGDRGAHAFRDVGTYDRGALAFGRASLVGDLPASSPAVDVLVLGPSPEELPDSSLTHMNALFVERFGSRGPAFLLEDGVFDLPRFDERIARAIVGGYPILLLGTSFAFVHFLDELGDHGFRLPQGSRVMQTGGFKGRSRVVDGAVLRKSLGATFGLPERAIVSEYGMTELSSQFYERTAVDAAARTGVLHEPPWARVVPVHPETLAPVPEGEVGIARIEDLLNVDSAFAILTQDRVRRVAGGFELLGRAEGAPPRGCSLSIDELLGR